VVLLMCCDRVVTLQVDLCRVICSAAFAHTSWVILISLFNTLLPWWDVTNEFRAKVLNCASCNPTLYDSRHRTLRAWIIIIYRTHYFPLSVKWALQWDNLHVQAENRQLSWDIFVMSFSSRINSKLYLLHHIWNSAEKFLLWKMLIILCYLCWLLYWVLMACNWKKKRWLAVHL